MKLRNEFLVLETVDHTLSGVCEVRSRHTKDLWSDVGFRTETPSQQGRLVSFHFSAIKGDKRKSKY